jgi:predicted Zn-dependent protease
MAEDSKEVAQVAKVETIQERPQQVAQPDHSVEAFISQAIDKQLPIETIERFLAMRKELRQDQAKEAFTMAMAQFQADCPVIAKTKEVKNKSGQVTYRYAPIDSIIIQVKKVLGENKLAYDFTETRDETRVTVTCTITHSLGHTKTSSFTVEIGSEAFMTDTQKYGARNTFAKRYAFMNVLGIATGDEDTDAKEIEAPVPKAPKLPADPKAKIVALMRQLGHSDPNSMKDRVIEFTQLDPNDPTNTQEIVDRLSVLLSEMDNENN